MQIQTIFKAGNSPFVVSIPPQVARDVSFTHGIRVTVSKVGEDAVIIKKVKKQTTSVSPVNKEFNNWMKGVLKEDAEILEELA